MAAPSIEYFDIVNDRDVVIGRAPRAEVHAKRLLHRAVHILVFDRQGRDRKSTRLNSSHSQQSRMPSSA